MPWTGSRMEDRLKFIEEWQSGDWSVSELCRHFDISRNTGYETIKRFEQLDAEGLRERSRAPHTHPNQTPAAVVTAIVAMASKYPRWGPRKVRALLKRHQPKRVWPATSTIGDVLRREGVLAPTRKRSGLLKVTRGYRPPLEVSAPNDMWRADHKGHRLSGDKQRCEPLAITDHVSRFALACELVSSTAQAENAKIFERVFKEYGLPRAILSDNGAPFASKGVAGLTKLSASWLMLGILPLRITPGKPHQNGGHERFNGTLQFEAMTPMAKTKAAQERRQRKFLRIYNEVRPHEALDDRTPSEVYVRSPRPHPGRIEEFEYGPSLKTVRVDCKGYVRFDGQYLYLCEALVGRDVGFTQETDGLWSVHFGPLEIAIYIESTKALDRYSDTVFTDEDRQDPSATASTSP